jgi:alanine dehydrogenase
MIIGAPKDIKDNEYRVSATPAGAEQLVEESHYCFVHQLLKFSN